MLATCTDILEEAIREEYRDRGESAARRNNRIRAARQRLAEGWYDRDDLLDTILERILVDLALV